MFLIDWCASGMLLGSDLERLQPRPNERNATGGVWGWGLVAASLDARFAWSIWIGILIGEADALDNQAETKHHMQRGHEK